MKYSDFQKLNIAYAEHDRVWAYCPYHKDVKRPNLSISLLDKYYGRYKCWACGETGSLSKNQMGKLNLLEHVVYKNSEKGDGSCRTIWKQFNTSCYNNLQKFPLLKLGLAKQLNISTKSLDDWQVGYDGTSFTVPMFREDLSEYYSQQGTCGIQRRFPDGTKRCITGSRLGLMYPQDNIGDYYLFICEGFSDGISVWDLGLQSIARPHCHHIDGTEEFFDDVLERCVEQIIIIPDNDTVGMDGAQELHYILSDLYYYEEDAWESYCDVTIFSFDGAKDIREYIAKVGKQQVRKELLRMV